MALCIQCMQGEGDPKAGGLCTACRPFKQPLILGRVSTFLVPLLVLQKTDEGAP